MPWKARTDYHSGKNNFELFKVQKWPVTGNLNGACLCQIIKWKSKNKKDSKVITSRSKSVSNTQSRYSCAVLQYLLSPLYSYIRIHILLTVLNNFFHILMMRICLTINTFSRWSFPLLVTQKCDSGVIF